MNNNQNNQPSCPPRLVSYDKALDHKITNQYMNNIRPIKQTSVNNQNMSVHNQNISIQQNPAKAGSIYNYSTTQMPGYNPSINRPNNYIPPQRMPPQTTRLNNTTGDLSMQNMNNYVQPINHNLNVNMLNPTLNNDPTDFNNNFYTKAEKSKKLSFFNVSSNIKQMSKQNKLSKWALIFVIVQVICIVTLETLLSTYFKHYFDKLDKLGDKSTNDEIYLKNLGQMKSLLIYQLIFVFSQFYVLVMYYDSFRLSSSYQLIAVSVFNFIIAGYSIIQIFQTVTLFNDLSSEKIKINNEDKINKQFASFEKVKDENKYKNIFVLVIVIAGYLVLSALVLLFMSVLLFKKFGWNIYRNVGADIKKTVVLKRRYNFGIIMKFKFFFIFGIITQCLNFSEDEKDFSSFVDGFETIVKCYAAPVLAVILIINIICGYISVKKQNKFLMVIHIITDMIFIIFSVYMIYIINNNGKYNSVRRSLSGFAIIEILILFISIYFSMEVMVDFNTVDLTEDFEKNEIGRRLSL